MIADSFIFFWKEDLWQPPPYHYKGRVIILQSSVHSDKFNVHLSPTLNFRLMFYFLLKNFRTFYWVVD